MSETNCIWKHLYIAALAILSVCVASCSDDDKEDSSLEVSPENILLDSNGEGKLTITTNAMWSVSTSSTWLTFSMMSGVGNGQVTVWAKDKSKSERRATVTIKGENSSRQVDVTQAAPKKIYIYGDVANFPDQVPFQPGVWDAAAMRFSDTEGAHLPTIPDDVFFGLKTLIFDVSDVSADFDLKVMNGWWSNTYYDHVVWHDGLNELQITETMAKECAKGAEGRDLDLMLYNGTMTLKAVYYEE